MKDAAARRFWADNLIHIFVTASKRCFTKPYTDPFLHCDNEKLCVCGVRDNCWFGARCVL